MGAAKYSNIFIPPGSQPNQVPAVDPFAEMLKMIAGKIPAVPAATIGIKQPYSVGSKCLKCGNERSYSIGLGQTTSVQDAATTKYDPSRNALRRNCNRCNYEWYEAPLDSNFPNAIREIIDILANEHDETCARCEKARAVMATEKLFDRQLSPDTTEQEKK